MKYEYEFQDRWTARMRRECHFGIIEAVAAGIAYLGAVGTAAASTLGAASATGLATIGVSAADLAAVGVTTASIGTAEMGILTGAALGAGEAAAVGGDPGMGALGGAISGGTLAAAGPVLGSTLGSAFAGDVVAGAAGGTLSAAATGGDLGTGALGGAASGGISYGLGQLTPPAAGSAGGAAGGAGAGGAVTPGVESVTVHGAAPPPGINLAGVVNKAPTAADKTTGTPGVESVTVPGVRTPTSGAAPLVPTAAGLVPGSNLQPKTPAAGIGAAQTGGQIGTDNRSTVLPTSDAGIGTEKVTVTGDGSLAPSTPHAGVISPTGAGALASTVSPEETDAEKKKNEQPAGSDQTFLDKLGTKTEDTLSNPAVLLAGGVLAADAGGLFHGGNAAGTLAGGAGAQADALTNTATDTATEAARLRALGNQDIVKGQDLQDYLRTGTLPPGLQAQLDAAKASAQAGARQMYSNMGMGQGNSSLYQDLANIDMVAAGKSADMATELFNSGTALQGTGNSLISSALSNTNAGTEIYTNLMKTNLAADSNLSAGVNNFVTALAKLGGASTTSA